MEIRAIEKTDDLYEISGVYEKSWKMAYKGIIPQDYLDSLERGRWVEMLKNADDTNTLVVIDDGCIVGTSAYGKSRYSDSGDGEIISIYLLPEYVGRGVGRALFEKTLDELKIMGFRKVVLWVLDDNIKAKSFYEQFGFFPSEDSLYVEIGGKNLKEIKYVKTF